MRDYKKEETALFYTGWALVALCCCIFGLFQIMPPSFLNLFLTSCLCHPLVPYAALIGGWFLASQTVERLSRHRINIGMRYRDGYLWASLAILIANFLVKNLLLALWDIDLLKGITLYP